MEGMATHSRILAWRTPWAEEPGRLQSMGSQRVVHNGSNWTHTWTHLNEFYRILNLTVQIVKDDTVTGC